MRIFLALLLLALVNVAFANGAMGLGLEMFDLRYWAAYCGVIVIAEAWLLGRWLERRWYDALARSLLANALTAGLCGAGGFFAPLLHYPLVGTSADPNPFLSAVALLTLWAIPSALLESVFWLGFYSKANSRLWTVFLAHLATIPLGLAVLLIPDRPYVGMEATTDYWRRHRLLQVKKAVEMYLFDHQALPEFRTPREFFDRLGVSTSDRAFGRVVLPRLSFGPVAFGQPQVNARLSRVKVDYSGEASSSGWTWLLKRSEDDGTSFTLWFSPVNGVKVSRVRPQ